jgi:hypothetical protein
MGKWCVFCDVRTEFLNIMLKSFSLNGLIGCINCNFKTVALKLSLSPRYRMASQPRSHYAYTTATSRELKISQTLMQVTPAFPSVWIHSLHVPVIWPYTVWVKSKAVPLSPCWRQGERKYRSYSLFTSVLDGGEWSASRPGRDLPPG